MILVIQEGAGKFAKDRRNEEHSPSPFLKGEGRGVGRNSFSKFIFIMQRLRPDVDVVLDILKAVLAAQPLSSFTQSLLNQYQERGGLSKKQLEGLYSKAVKVKAIPPNKLATLEAIILKKPQKYRSALPPTKELFTKDEATGELINSILEKYPQHKRVLFFKSRYDNNEVLSPADIAELQKFKKLLK